MGFIVIGQEWSTYTKPGSPRSAAMRLRPGEWCWSERKQGESGLCPVGEVVTIEDACQLEDEQGKDIPGGLERLHLWETIAGRRGLPVPKQRNRRPTKRAAKGRRTKAA